MVDDVRQQFGNRIRMLLREQNLTIRGFGLMVGLSKDYIIDLEFGRKSPTLDTLVKVASGFGMSVSELLEGVGESGDGGASQDEQNPIPQYYHTLL